MKNNYSAKWIPENVPMLVIGGEDDAITPFSLFENDQRFKRPNITKALVKGAGHLPWVEKPVEVRQLFHAFHTALIV